MTFLCGVPGVGTFPIQSGDSLTIYSLPLGFGKLSLRRQNFLHTCIRCILRTLLIGQVYG